MHKLIVGVLASLFAAQALAAYPAKLVDECKKGLKEYVVNQVGVFTKANEIAINRNCNSIPNEYLCFIKKTKEQAKVQGDNFTSHANQGIFEQECGVR
ncbi:MAG TPA: hypothetical protein VIF82_19130 [Burkholderiaceae bacterium]|jgi:hypothetical protein